MDVETKMTLALGLVGFGAVATGALGIVLPPGERIAAGLALVVGAGIGVVAIAIGTRMAGEADSSYANVVPWPRCSAWPGPSRAWDCCGDAPQPNARRGPQRRERASASRSSDASVIGCRTAIRWAMPSSS
jgi:hypothetical protein